MYSKFSFGEVYRWIYGQKFSFTATLMSSDTVGNLVLRQRLFVAVKLNFLPYIGQYTSSNENFEYGYPHSNALLTFFLQKDS